MLMLAKIKIVVLLMAAILIAASCSNGIKNPSIESYDLSFSGVTLTSIDFTLKVNVDNPNPFGIKLDRIAFDIYYERDGEWQHIGQGERSEDADIRANGLSTIDIPISVGNIELVQAIFEMIGPNGGDLSLKVSGSVWLDVELTSIEIPFEFTKTVTIDFPSDLINLLEEIT